MPYTIFELKATMAIASSNDKDHRPAR